MYIQCMATVLLTIFLTYSVKSVKTHFYYTMKNCDNDPVTLQKNLRNIVEHYKVCFVM